jgi:hypothetical protein
MTTSHGVTMTLATARRMKTAALCWSVAYLAVVPWATLSAAECAAVDAREVVEHARMNGYRFETTRTSSEGFCDRGSSASIFFASATADAEVVCEVRIFWRKAPSAVTAPTSAGTAAAAGAGQGSSAATSEWVIRFIRIVGPDGYDEYVQGSAEESVGSERGWKFSISAPPNTTLQFRIDQVAFTTLKECAQWRNAF